MITREYTILMLDKNKNAPFVWKGTSKTNGYEWLEAVGKKPKFQGLTPVWSSRLLINGRRINASKSVLWLNCILLVILIFKLMVM